MTPVSTLHLVKQPMLDDRLVLDLASALHASRSRASAVSFAAQDEAHTFVTVNGYTAGRALLGELRAAYKRRQTLERLVYRHKGRDKKGKLASGERSIVYLERSTGATVLAPLSALTDAELLDMLPRDVRVAFEGA